MKNIVAFFYADYANPTYRIMAEMMSASVHMTLPGYQVVMLTDNESPSLTGTDHTIRASIRFEKNKLMPARMQIIDAYLKDSADAQIIFADPDILFLNEINLFESEFDVLLTWRPHFPSMPFNTGVMATRTTNEARTFWHSASLICQTVPEPLDAWYGDQISVAMSVGLNTFFNRTSETILSGDAAVKLLPCDKYNHSPDTYDKPHNADIVHLKGSRKELMVRYFRDLCEKSLGIKDGFLQLEKPHIDLLLLQRTDYGIVMEAEIDTRENLISAKLTLDLYNEFRSLSKHLPEEAENILDIGCGLGGINYFFYNHYRAQNPKLHLLDKNEVSDNIYFGFEETASAYNNLEFSKSLLTNAGVPVDHIQTTNIIEEDFPTNKKYDIIFSSISWGFHYPVSTYIDEVVKTLSERGHLIIDVRKGTDGLNILQKHFTTIDIVSDTKKYHRVCAKK